MKQILIIDDDAELTDLLTEYLSNHGYGIECCHDGVSGLSTAKSRPDIDCILLDVMMPELDGFEVLRQLRHDCYTPVIMLTARGDDYDKVLGLELGADDYLAKPFNHRELLARIKALLRRSELTSESTASIPLHMSGVSLDVAQHTARVNGQLLTLTGTEFLLLEMLMSNAGKRVTKEMISQKILGRRLVAFDRSIDMHVSNLRKKLASVMTTPLITTVRGAGYIFRDLDE